MPFRKDEEELPLPRGLKWEELYAEDMEALGTPASRPIISPDFGKPYKPPQDPATKASRIVGRRRQSKGGQALRGVMFNRLRLNGLPGEYTDYQEKIDVFNKRRAGRTAVGKGAVGGELRGGSGSAGSTSEQDYNIPTAPAGCTSRLKSPPPKGSRTGTKRREAESKKS